MKDGEDEAQVQSQGKGASAMQPAASGVEGVKLIKDEIGFAREEPVNEKVFIKRKRSDVPVNQVGSAITLSGYCY